MKAESPKWGERVLGLLQSIHRRLLPNRREIGWTPYLWLFYLSFPIWRWFGSSSATPVTWGLGALTLVFFLRVYFHGFWQRGAVLWWNIAALAVLGILWTPFDSSAMVFYIYGAGFAGAVGPPRQGVRVLVALALVVVAAALIFDRPIFWTLLTLAICGVVGGANIYFGQLTRQGDALRRSREEVQRLATVAERERIARDLHDLLGHTLSLITLKAELARKLSERDDPRAVDEIREVERISRDALRQVREAVEGFRETGLAGELARARLVCEARGIDLGIEVSPGNLDSRSEVALAMVVREAVTNVARHSGASRCSIHLRQDGDHVVLTIQDDGRGAASPGQKLDSMAGHGLLGMGERLRELGGRLEVDGSQGWTLRAFLPAQMKNGPSEESTAGTAPNLAWTGKEQTA